MKEAIEELLASVLISLNMSSYVRPSDDAVRDKARLNNHKFMDDLRVKAGGSRPLTYDDWWEGFVTMGLQILDSHGAVAAGDDAMVISGSRINRGNVANTP